MIDVDRVARRVGDALRAWTLEANVRGLADEAIGPVELPVVMGIMRAEGAVGPGSRRWRLLRWVQEVRRWVTARRGLRIEKSRPSRIVPGARPVKSVPNWLEPHEQAAWKAARERAGLRIQGVEDAVRARLRQVLADAIALGASRERQRQIVSEKMAAAFPLIAKSWDLIAQQELAQAYGDGVLVVAAADSRKVRVVLQAGACDKCRAAYLNAAGNSKVWDVAALIASGMAPPRLHPRCRCTPEPVLPKNLRRSIA